MRVIGVYAVILIHVCGATWSNVDIHSFEWQVLNFWHGSIVRWAVPVYVMISGALFLSRDIPIRKIYSKYLFRIFTAFIFWSFLYAMKYYVSSGDIVRATASFLRGHFHMWFLFMISGLYMIAPFMRKIAESESLTRYFLALAVLFAFLLPETVKAISLFSETYGKFADGITKGFGLHSLGWAGYFLLGYFLNTNTISRKTERIIYAVGAISFIAGLVMSVCASMIQNKADQFFYSNITVNTMCISAAVFVFFKAKFNRPSRIIRALSQYSFGAYLVHSFVLSFIAGKMGFHVLAFNPVFSAPLISLVVFIVSFAISAIMNHIPVLNKYIV